MADNSKYQIFLNELVSIENQISMLLEQVRRSEEKNTDSERQIQLLKKENELLKLQMENYSKELELYKSGKFTSGLNEKDKAAYRQKIHEALKKIENYLENSPS